MASAVGKPLGTLARSSVLVENTEVRCKRRINFAGNGAPYQGAVQPASVARRNARERNRVKQVNNGFATLRNHIPVSVAAALGAPHSGRGASKKLSKVETLRLAVEYIRSLQDMLDESNSENYYTGTVAPAGAATRTLMPETKVELSPPTSEASCSPPPPSHTPYSDHGPAYTPQHHTPAPHTPHYHQDNYEPMSPEDEELLDVISWWQQSQ